MTKHYKNASADLFSGVKIQLTFMSALYNFSKKFEESES